MTKKTHFKSPISRTVVSPPATTENSHIPTDPRSLPAVLFLTIRSFTTLTLIALSSLTVNLITVTDPSQLPDTSNSSPTASRRNPPGILLLTLGLSIPGALYTLFTIPAHNASYMPYPATLSVDTLFLTAFSGLAVVWGLSVANLTCDTLHGTKDVRLSIMVPAGDTVPEEFARLVFPAGEKAAMQACVKVKVLWALVISDGGLFIMGVAALVALWMRNRRMQMQEQVAPYRSAGGSPAAVYCPVGNFMRPYPKSTMFRDDEKAPDKPSRAKDVNESVSLSNRWLTPTRNCHHEDELEMNRPITICPERGGSVSKLDDVSHPALSLTGRMYHDPRGSQAYGGGEMINP